VVDGEAAVMLQHEVDHLYGRLLSDDVRPSRFIPFNRFSRFSGKLFSFCYDQKMSDEACHFLIEAGWLRRRRAAPSSGIR